MTHDESTRTKVCHSATVEQDIERLEHQDHGSELQNWHAPQFKKVVLNSTESHSKGVGSDGASYPTYS